MTGLLLMLAYTENYEMILQQRFMLKAIDDVIRKREAGGPEYEEA